MRLCAACGKPPEGSNRPFVALSRVMRLARHLARPEGSLTEAQGELLAEVERSGSFSIVQLIYQHRAHEGQAKDYEFRRSVESADAQLAATVANYDDVLVSLTADLAASYLQLRTLQQQLAVAEANVEVQQQGLGIATMRVQGRHHRPARRRAGEHDPALDPGDDPAARAADRADPQRRGGDGQADQLGQAARLRGEGAADPRTPTDQVPGASSHDPQPNRCQVGTVGASSSCSWRSPPARTSSAMPMWRRRRRR